MVLSLVLSAILGWSGPVAYRFDESVGPRERVAFVRAVALWPHPASETPNHWFTAVLWGLGLDGSVLVRVDRSLGGFGQTTLGPGPRRELVFHPGRTTADWLEADLAHEWGHVLGLGHEHQRPDRDLYVSFPPGFFEGLDPDRRADYALASSVASSLGPYDYESLMHYSSNVDGNRMVRRDTGAPIPGARGPSAGDLVRLAALEYPPQEQR